VGDDLIPILTRFHHDVLLPDVKRIVGEAVEAFEQRLRDEMQAGFDALAKRLDKLEVEYHMVVSGLKRIEERLDRVEGRLDGVEQRLTTLEHKLEKAALRSELQELKARVDGLQDQVRTLEARLDA
jgi:predicted  nucleic acid-binding Zn-ribbon protein